MMINGGLAWQIACDRLYDQVYGQGASTTSIISSLKEDTRNGNVHSLLRVGPRRNDNEETTAAASPPRVQTVTGREVHPSPPPLPPSPPANASPNTRMAHTRARQTATLGNVGGAEINFGPPQEQQMVTDFVMLL